MFVSGIDCMENLEGSAPREYGRVKLQQGPYSSRRNAWGKGKLEVRRRSMMRYSDTMETYVVELIQ